MLGSQLCAKRSLSSDFHNHQNFGSFLLYQLASNWHSSFSRVSQNQSLLQSLFRFLTTDVFLHSTQGSVVINLQSSLTLECFFIWKSLMPNLIKF